MLCCSIRFSQNGSKLSYKLLFVFAKTVTICLRQQESVISVFQRTPRKRKCGTSMQTNTTARNYDFNKLKRT